MSHVMLSYNWDNQELVKKVYTDLTKRGINCWMDIHGGMKVDMMTSMSEGVEKSAAIIAFCTEKYQNSKNCQTELKYAYTESIPILPVICDKTYTKPQARGEEKNAAEWPCGWLGATIAGKIYVDFRKDEFYENSLAALMENIEILTGIKCGSESEEKVNTLNRVKSLENFKNALDQL